MLLYLRLLTDTLRRSGTRRRDLLWENLALRQQLAVYQRQTYRPALRQGDRLFWSWEGKTSSVPGRRELNPNGTEFCTPTALRIFDRALGRSPIDVA